MKLNVLSVFLIVSGAALVGMVMGGLFGWGAAALAPDFFIALQPWQTNEPVGTAVFLGATVGVLLGGGLGVFGLIVQVAMRWVDAPRRGERSPHLGEQ